MNFHWGNVWLHKSPEQRVLDSGVQEEKEGQGLTILSQGRTKRGWLLKGQTKNQPQTPNTKGAGRSHWKSVCRRGGCGTEKNLMLGYWGRGAETQKATLTNRLASTGGGKKNSL